MGSVPLGGIDITNHEFGSVSMFGTEFSTDALVPATPADDGVTFPKGLILARLTSTKKLVPYDITGGAAGTEVPVAVLGSDVINATPAAEVDLQVIVKGDVRLAKLSIFGGEPVDKIEQDKLRQTGIFARPTTQLARFDNPQ